MLARGGPRRRVAAGSPDAPRTDARCLTRSSTFARSPRRRRRDCDAAPPFSGPGRAAARVRCACGTSRNPCGRASPGREVQRVRSTLSPLECRGSDLPSPLWRGSAGSSSTCRPSVSPRGSPGRAARGERVDLTPASAVVRDGRYVSTTLIHRGDEFCVGALRAPEVGALRAPARCARLGRSNGMRTSLAPPASPARGGRARRAATYVGDGPMAPMRRAFAFGCGLTPCPRTSRARIVEKPAAFTESAPLPASPSPVAPRARPGAAPAG